MEMRQQFTRVDVSLFELFNQWTKKKPKQKEIEGDLCTKNKMLDSMTFRLQYCKTVK